MVVALRISLVKSWLKFKGNPVSVGKDGASSAGNDSTGYNTRNNTQ